MLKTGLKFVRDSMAPASAEAQLRGQQVTYAEQYRQGEERRQKENPYALEKVKSPC